MLVDLKTEQISHQDVGQMDMYIRMYDELKRTEGDNPTIGLILCSQTSKDMARYSMLKDNDRLFQAKYLTFLPTERVCVMSNTRETSHSGCVARVISTIGEIS